MLKVKRQHKARMTLSDLLWYSYEFNTSLPKNLAQIQTNFVSENTNFHFPAYSDACTQNWSGNRTILDWNPCVHSDSHFPPNTMCVHVNQVGRSTHASACAVAPCACLRLQPIGFILTVLIMKNGCPYICAHTTTTTFIQASTATRVKDLRNWISNNQSSQ